MANMKMPLYRQIYLYIIEKIRAGTLKPGDRVPSENELAERFGVSRITSKRALEKLAQDEIIVRIQGQGSFVRDHLPDLANVLVDTVETMDVQVGRHGAARLIGFILPDFGDVYATRLFRAVESRGSELGYQLLVRLTYGRPEVETEGITSFTNTGVTGLIVFPIAGEYYNPALLRLALDSFPLVVVDRYLKGIPAHAVHTDNVKAAYELTNYLLDRGHQHIAFLSPPAENTSTIEERILGFTQAFSHRGLGLNPRYVFSELTSTLPQSFTMSNVETDKERLRALMAAHPELTAFVASEYNVAHIVRQTILEVGKSIPDDYAITCFDSPENPLEPCLFTHIQQDETAMGTTAVNILDALVRGEKPEVKTVIDFRLIEGMST